MCSSHYEIKDFSNKLENTPKNPILNLPKNHIKMARTRNKNNKKKKRKKQTNFNDEIFKKKNPWFHQSILIHPNNTPPLWPRQSHLL